MYGAILGDMIGSPYEFDQGNKSKVFPLFTGESHFTDDTVITINPYAKRVFGIRRDISGEKISKYIKD